MKFKKCLQRRLSACEVQYSIHEARYSAVDRSTCYVFSRVLPSGEGPPDLRFSSDKQAPAGQYSRRTDCRERVTPPPNSPQIHLVLVDVVSGKRAHHDRGAEVDVVRHSNEHELSVRNVTYSHTHEVGNGDGHGVHGGAMHPDGVGQADAGRQSRLLPTSVSFPTPRRNSQADFGRRLLVHRRVPR